MPTVFAFARETDPPPPPEGGRAILLPDERWGRCDIKSVKLLPNVLASQKARDAGAMEAILVRDGIAWRGRRPTLHRRGACCAPRPKGPRILPGVTRGAAIEAARKLGYQVEERAFGVEEMFSAQEVFFASTTLWTYPLVEIEGRPIGGGKPGPVAARIREALQAEFSGSANTPTSTPASGSTSSFRHRDLAQPVPDYEIVVEIPEYTAICPQDSPSGFRAPDDPLRSGRALPRARISEALRGRQPHRRHLVRECRQPDTARLRGGLPAEDG